MLTSVRMLLTVHDVDLDTSARGKQSYYDPATPSGPGLHFGLFFFSI